MCNSRSLLGNGVVFHIMTGLLIFGGLTGWLQAADHRDAPLTVLDGRTDINDVYVFQSPANPNNTVLIMTVNPGADPASSFSDQVAYQFFVDGDTLPADCGRGSRSDLNNDGITDIFDFGIMGLEWLTDCQFFPPDPGCTFSQIISLFFSPPTPTNQQFLFVTGRGIDGSGEVGQNIPVVDTTTFNQIGQARTGIFDDPFFFDLVAFQDSLQGGTGGRSFCDGSEDDFFAGLDVSAIVLEIPSSVLDSDGDGKIGVWARTEMRGEQIDRLGRPALNTIVIPEANFGTERFNRGNPQCDNANFRQVAIDALIGLGNNSSRANSLADILLPDILPYDNAIPDGFPNGRRLEDDVIDAELALILGGTTTTDCIDNNDKPFQSAFPYLASPNSSNP